MAMQGIEYDAPLIEKAVFLAARRNAGHEEALHREIDGLYNIQDEQQREQAFRRAFRQAFSALDLDRVIAQFLAERPSIGRMTGQCIVHEAPRSKAEAAELYVRTSSGQPAPGDRTVVIHVCPESLVDPDRLADRMRRELVHIADMLDARFDYDRSAFDGLAGMVTVVHDRYRVLWDIFVEGRLIREGKVSEAGLPQLRRAFLRALTHRAQPPHPDLFDELLQADDLTHGQLLRWANDPQTILGHVPSGPSSGDGPDLGALCPFCHFPTFDWYPIQDCQDGSLLARLRGAQPGWQPLKGACRQCVETYLAAEPIPNTTEGCPIQ